MAKAKKTRKQLLKRDDAFLSAASQGAEWAKQNKISLAAGATAVAIVIAVIWGGAEFIRIRNRDASAKLEAALAVKEKGFVVGQDETADPTSEPPSFASEADKDKAFRQKLEEVVEEAGNAGVGALARLYLAGLHESRDEKEEAEKAFGALVHDLSTADSMYFLAVERAAYLQESRGDKQAAIETLGRLTGGEGLFYTDYAAFNQGRLHQKLGELDRARTLYEQIEKEYPDSPVLDEVERRLDQIGRTPEPEPEAASEADAAANKEAVPEEATAADSGEKDAKNGAESAAPDPEADAEDGT